MNNIITADFNGTPIHFTGEAWVSLTDQCRPFKKRASDFLKLPSTKRYVEALKRNPRVTGIPSPESSPLGEKISLNEPYLFIKKGRRGGAIWAHRWLALECARWLDADFSVWCNEIIDGILTGELVVGPAPLPAKLPPFLSEWHHQRFLAKKAAVEELLEASKQWGRFLKTAQEIQARHPGERGFSDRNLIRDFYRWKKNEFDDLSLLTGFTKKAA